MVSTFTPNRGYEQPGTGDYIDGWGVVLNDNFAIIDSNISSTLTVSLSSSNVTLSATQAENMAFQLTGTLTADVALIYPATGGTFIVSNQTSGSFLVTVRTSAGGSQGVYVPQGTRTLLYSDATNVYLGTEAAGVPIGTIIDYAVPSVPGGWFLCAGQAISRVVYSRLFAVISTTYGSGDGSTTFNLPDCRGRVRAGRDDMTGSAANRLTSAGSGVNGTALGGAGGAQNITLTSGQIPVITPTGTVFVTYPAQFYQLAFGGNSYQQGTSATAFNSYNNASTVPPGGQTFNLSMGSFGGGSAHINAQPTICFNTIIKAF